MDRDVTASSMDLSEQSLPASPAPDVCPGQQDPGVCLPYLTDRFARQWQRLLRDYLQQSQTSRAQYLTLLYLENGCNGMCQRDLARHMGIEQPALVRMLDLLEQHAMVHRERCSFDRRAHHVHVTDKGKRFLDDMGQRLESMDTVLFQGLTPQDIVQTTRIIRKVFGNALMLGTTNN